MAPCGGIILTGGASTRMGTDKASLAVGDTTLAERTALLVGRVAGPLVEVGPGRTHLGAVKEEPAGSGPLVATVAGWNALKEAGWAGPVLVVATDLPRLNLEVLQGLAAHPSTRSVVPRSSGRLQSLCARYAAADLDVAANLAGNGSRAMRQLLAAIDPLVLDGPWGGALADVDTPADLAEIER